MKQRIKLIVKDNIILIYKQKTRKEELKIHSECSLIINNVKRIKLYLLPNIKQIKYQNPLLEIQSKLK